MGDVGIKVGHDKEAMKGFSKTLMDIWNSKRTDSAVIAAMPVLIKMFEFGPITIQDCHISMGRKKKSA